MKKELEHWARKRAGELREIGQEVSWAVRKLHAEDKTTAKPQPQARSVVRPTMPAAAGNPRQELTERMDREIHRAYYRDGGVRFFACELRRYAAVAMDREEELQLVWAAVYNTNLRPMLRQMEKLEQALEELQARSTCAPLPLENGRLLQRMRAFAERVHTDRLDQESGWQVDAYRETVRDYVEKLSEQLLEAYRPPEEEQT